jgi:hypothetical protein
MVLTAVIGQNRVHLIPEIEKWCEEQIGRGKRGYISDNSWEGLDHIEWSICNTIGRTTFSFKHEHDYEWFILRWGSDDNDRS